MNILIVDDEKDILTSLSIYITRMGNCCKTATSGAEALVLLNKEQVDVVVTDFNMPVMNGIELLKIIRKLHPLTDVIILTGFAEIENAIDAVNLGAYAFFRKPLDMDDFQKTINQIKHERNGSIKNNISSADLVKEYRKLRSAYEKLHENVMKLKLEGDSNG